MIVFARHGETPPNRDGLILGRADPGLTDEGRRQAARLADLLGKEEPVAVMTSPLLRARETAEVIAAACGLEAETDERLVEIDWGTWEGRPVAGITSAETERLRADAGTAPEGESLTALGRRVEEFCGRALERDGLVVAVTHVSPIKAAVAWTLGAPDAAAFRMFVALASVTRVALRSRGPVLVSFNETAHLRG
ncbi:MAG: histidine phosphatase family protein [Actinomycetota bacterium]|nr:histidine phosphatase family protein [Actinomycetota bacterium]